MENIEWIRVNPAGNITCLVLSKVPRDQYMEVATRLLALPYEDFEQVGFIINENTMEMAGLEFCGNASRGFALWSAEKQGLKGDHSIYVNVSGIEKPLEVFLNTETGFTRAYMPLPDKIEIINEGMIPNCPKLLRVDLGGIMHFVIIDKPYSDSMFSLIKSYGASHFNPPALGVMFVDSKTYNMVPVVYVREVDTIYHEGSCGSGAVAAIIALEDNCAIKKNTFHCELIQPSGNITATLYKKNNKIQKITIEGPVEIGQVERSVFKDY
jgi:diaminopimelate epimerase